MIGVMGVVRETNTESDYMSFYGHFFTVFVFRKVKSAGRKWQECWFCVVDLRLLRKWAETAAVQQLFGTKNAADNDTVSTPYANVANILVLLKLKQTQVTV